MADQVDVSKQQAQNEKAQVLQRQYNAYQELLTDLQTQASTLTSQIQEHEIVDKTLSSIPPEKRTGRKCFKMVGGVLIDKSIDEVIKILTTDMKKMKEQKEKTDNEVKKVSKEMEDWMKKNNVKIVKNNTTQ